MLARDSTTPEHQTHDSGPTLCLAHQIGSLPFRWDHGSQVSVLPFRIHGKRSCNNANEDELGHSELDPKRFLSKLAGCVPSQFAALWCL